MCDSEKIKCGRSVVVRRSAERASGCKQGIFLCGSFIIIECAALMASRGSQVARFLHCSFNYMTVPNQKVINKSTINVGIAEDNSHVGNFLSNLPAILFW